MGPDCSRTFWLSAITWYTSNNDGFWATFGILVRPRRTSNINFEGYASLVDSNPNSKVHGANMGLTWGRQDPGAPHVGPMKLAIRVYYETFRFNLSIYIYIYVCVCMYTFDTNGQFITHEIIVYMKTLSRHRGILVVNLILQIWIPSYRIYTGYYHIFVCAIL